MRDINQLHPKVKELALKLVSECSKQGINIKITECYRTVAEQDEFYSWGRTKVNPNTGKMTKVTNARGSSYSSYHQWGLAFDICINSKTDSYNATLLTKAGKIGQSLGLTWGGSWTKPVDRPHFQYTFGLKLDDLRAGKRPPSYTPPQDDFTLAVNKLVQKGVIKSPQYWLNYSYDLKYVQALIINMSLTEKDFNSALKRLNQAGIVNDLNYWTTNQTYSLENVRALIKNWAKKN